MNDIRSLPKVSSNSASSKKASTVEQAKQEQTQPIAQDNLRMIIEDLERKISKLSILDTTSMDSQSTHLNLKIENLLGEVSLNSKEEDDKKILTFSPISLKAQDSRSITTLSTNSSSNKAAQGGYQKLLRFNNQSVVTSSSQPINGVSKSEIKRNWKLQNGQEFKIPSPRYKGQQYSERRQCNKRNRSAFRETGEDIQDPQTDQEQENFRQQTTLKKRPMSSTKEELAENVQRLVKQRIINEEIRKADLHSNTYKRQRFA